jgi:hypothetical protein
VTVCSPQPTNVRTRNKVVVENFDFKILVCGETRLFRDGNIYQVIFGNHIKHSQKNIFECGQLFSHLSFNFFYLMGDNIDAIRKNTKTLIDASIRRLV